MNAKSNASRSGSARRVSAARPMRISIRSATPGVGEVGGGDLGVLLGELARDQAPARSEAARDADRRVAGERAELERFAHTGRLAEKGQKGALVGGDLHPRDRAHRRGVGRDPREHLVLAGPVVDHVVVELVGEFRELADLRLPSARRAGARRRSPQHRRPHPRRAPASPAQTDAKSSTSGRQSSTAAATPTAIGSYSSVGSARRSALRITNQAASSPSAIPLPPAASGMPSLSALSSPSAASIPRAPQPIASSSGRDGAEPTLERGHEDRDAERAGKEVADVVVDERGREVAPPVAADRADDRAELVEPEIRRAIDDVHDRRGDDHRGRRDRLGRQIDRDRARRTALCVACAGASCGGPPGGGADRRRARASAPACAAACRNTGTR